MKVLLISKACVAGPYQRKLEEIAANPDVELRVVVPPYWRTGNSKEHLRRLHVQGYDLRVLKAVLNGHFHLHFYPGLAAELSDFRPDLVHIDEEPYNFATAHALFLARRVGARPLFFAWQNLARSYPPPFAWFESYCYRHAAAIAGSQAALDVLRRKGFRGPATVIPQFGVDPQFFHPPGTEDSARPFTAGYVGRLIESKGLKPLLFAFKELAGTERLRIAGAGPLDKWLREYVAANSLSDRVAFAGQLAPEAVPEFIRSLDVLVLPSVPTARWAEQFGRALVEAMACQVTVVGSNTGEIPTVIGDAGLLVPPGDHPALASALAKLRDDHELRRELGRKGRERVLDRFTHARIAAATVDFYRDRWR